MSDTTVFTGASSYSADFKSIISRAVSIASLPITQLTSQKLDLSDKQSAYTAIGTKLSSVESALTSLKNSIGASSYTALNTDSEVATAAVSTGAMQASYTIQVLDAGAYTRLLSTNNLDTELKAGASFTLTVDGEAVTLTPEDSTLASLASAINEAGVGVQASVINLGSNSSPDYRLSLQSTGVEDSTVTLDAGSGNVVDTLVHGHKATYQVDGQPATPIETDSRSVTIAPGLVVTLASAGETQIDVVRTSSSVATALQSLATAYNNAMDELDTYRGKNGGVLAGDSQLWSLTTDLRSLINFSGDGTVRSLASLGMSFDQNGRLSVDTSALRSVSMQDVESFLGDGVTSGFLKNAKNLMAEMNGDGSGIIDTTVSSLTSQISHQAELIDQNQVRVDALEEALTAQMAAADATIAALQQQLTYFTGLFDAMKNSSDD